MPLHPTRQHLRAIGLALIGYTLWVVADSCLKILSATPLPKYEIILFLNSGSVLTVFCAAWARGRRKFLRRRKPGLSWILGVLALANIGMVLVALQHLTLTTAYIIVFTGPMITALFAAIFLRERVGWINGLMIVIGFGGVVIALDPLRLLAGHGDWVGYGAGFTSVIFYTAYVLLLRFHGESEHPEALVLYPRLIVGIVGFLGCLLWHYEPISLAHTGLALIAGFFSATGWLFVTVASQQAPATMVAPYRYSQIITGALCGYLIWRDVPSWNMALGALVIIFAGLYIANHTRKGVDILEKREA